MRGIIVVQVEGDIGSNRIKEERVMSRSPPVVVFRRVLSLTGTLFDGV